MSYKDITGQRFGKLTAIKMIAVKYKTTKWLCKCDCGNEKEIPLDSLTSGKGISCGCFRKKMTGQKFRKHGLSTSVLYKTWLSMRNRCNNPKSVELYKNYGARGIKVCEEWNDYEQFYNWSIINGYKKGLTLDRIDNDRDYHPNNCRWATKMIQANNTRKNVFIEIDGEKKTLAEHARFYDLEYSTLYYRYNNIGLRGNELIKPLMKRKR